MKLWVHLVLAVILFASVPLAAQSQARGTTKSVAKSSITAYNFRWITYQNGWAELSYSLKNNTRSTILNIKYRVIFYGQNGEPIHYEDPLPVSEIPAGLAVTQSIKLTEGGLNIYHSTGKLRVEVLSSDTSKAE